jgi:hypothetical protein
VCAEQRAVTGAANLCRSQRQHGHTRCCGTAVQALFPPDLLPLLCPAALCRWSCRGVAGVTVTTTGAAVVVVVAGMMTGAATGTGE